MAIEYFFKEGRGWNEGAFDNSSVFIENPRKITTVDTLRKIKCFPQKKMALEFCHNWGINFESVVKMQTRFQYSWAINLGRNSFVPEFAEGYLLAESIGKTFLRAEVTI